MISALENSILKGLVHNETYTRKILPYVKDVYFTTTTGRTAFRICQEYFLEYNSCPSTQDIKVKLEAIENISDDEFKSRGGVFQEVYENKETIIVTPANNPYKTYFPVYFDAFKKKYGLNKNGELYEVLR